MRDLNYQLKQLCRRNRDGSRSTQANRERILTLIANQLHGIGYRCMNVRSLKPKHVEALVELWQNDGLGAGTIKNRMSSLRWWAEKIDKSNVIARENNHYGIAQREPVTQESKALRLDPGQLAKISDPYVRTSLRLQAAFGLRREEAIKFLPVYADRGDHIRLKPSWTKGGRARSIPVRTEQQRRVLDDAHKLAGKGSLIPVHLSYVRQLRQYERLTKLAGFSKLHGVRHGYAQRRYLELTGTPCPHQGGRAQAELSDDERLRDRRARLTVSAELGHGREAVSQIYLGR